jgi:hypothetical protein
MGLHTKRDGVSGATGVTLRYCLAYESIGLVGAMNREWVSGDEKEVS